MGRLVCIEQPPKIDEFWHEDQIYDVGDYTSLSFTLPDIHGTRRTVRTVERKVFVGDVLFAGSIGRQIAGGSAEPVVDSIMN